VRRSAFSPESRSRLRAGRSEPCGKRGKPRPTWSRGDWQSNVEYPLSGTPCQQVLAGDLCLYRDSVQQLFPADSDLVALGARSYLGIPLRSTLGTTLGHLAVLDTAPMSEDPRGLAIFQVFANRARVEMERLPADAMMRRAFTDMEVRLETAHHDLAATRQDLDLAYGGTIFLDEIGELPLGTQAKLLRVLQEREFEPVGSSQSKKTDVRVIAATNRDLEAECAAGRFRSDLLYRLNVVPIVMPPLRERREDIELLARFFLQRFARDLGKRVESISSASLGRLRNYAWPGNIRELSNLMERSVVLATGPVLEIAPAMLPAAALPVERRTAGEVHGTLDDVERQHILSVLERTNWRIDGHHGAARLLDLHASTLRNRTSASSTLARLLKALRRK